MLAAINGHCLGGGLELAVRCDLRIGAARAKLGMPPAKLGLIYSHTGLQKFIDVVGHARTQGALLHGAQRQRDRGRGDRARATTPPEDKIDEAAVALAAEIAAGAPLSARGNKRAIEMLNSSNA